MRMNPKIRELYYRGKLPDPTIEFDESFRKLPDEAAMRNHFERSFRSAAFSINGTSLAVREYFTVIAGCLRQINIQKFIGQKIKIATEALDFADLAAPALQKCFDESRADAFRALWRAVYEPIAAHTHMDSRIVFGNLDVQTQENGKTMVSIRVGAAEPRVRDVTLDGATRPMYQVADAGPAGIKWLEWSGETLGYQLPSSAERKFPIFVQSHALRQLQKRIDLPPYRPYLEAWLVHSLEEPKIVERDANDMLVEFRVDGNRLGYLVVTKLKDIVAVRTFKFLTMENTPEARLLSNKLKLKRCDIDWLRLHELSSFTQTDLREDQQLRGMLEECGCGHLFDLLKEGDKGFVPPTRQFADELRKYLRVAA